LIFRKEDAMQSLSPKARQILYTVVSVVAILLLVAAGMLLAGRLRGDKGATQTVVQPAAPTELFQPTATLAVTSAPVRVAVKDGRAESDTGIAILPRVELRGDRKYVLRVSSQAGAVRFKGSYSRSSLDPIAIDAMKEIAGATPWEAEIQPPSTEAQRWTLSVSLSTDPVGKNIQVQLWDVGPK
jgi:hypothetical protein